MKPIGITVECQSNSQELEKIKGKLLRVLSIYGLEDSEWSQAVSSQYFLLCLAKQLGWGEKEYQDLLNKCLSNFNVTYGGDFILDDNRLLITPDETNKIIECMKEEDKTEKLYSHSAKQRAENIRSNQMHLNFHYGLLVRIVSLEDTEVMRAIKHKCLEKLICSNAIENSLGGWYPFRVPWITARILISLRYVNYDSFNDKNKLTRIIQKAIVSLFRHIDESTPFWRSGVGKWVSVWESTGLCLEAIYTWGKYREYQKEIEQVINYVCSDVSMDQWLVVPSFSSEENANSTLSAVVLSSVIYRLTSVLSPQLFAKLQDRILSFYTSVLSLICHQKVDTIRQFCTIPQILHYIMSAIEENQQTNIADL